MVNFDLDEDLNLVLAKYPKLKFVDDTLSGEIDIFDNNDNYYSSYDIEIVIPKGYPHIFPSVCETGGRIPRIADRHINNDMGDCCVCVLQEADIRAKRGISIVDFINEYVIPFFANQIYYEANGKWANGEYKHGLAGILQYYSEIFGTQDIRIILKGIDVYLKNNTKSYEKCFCGSDKKLKRCHRITFLELEKMSKKRINDDYTYFLFLVVLQFKDDPSKLDELLTKKEIV